MDSRVILYVVGIASIIIIILVIIFGMNSGWFRGDEGTIPSLGALRVFLPFFRR